MLGDCVLCTVSAGSTTTATVATTDPPQFYAKAADYFNKGEYEVYCFAGSNIGVSRLASDWASYVLTVTPATAAYDATSCLELHRIFTVSELRDAINQAIELFARKYFIDLSDSTTITLAESTSNDENTLYTYEYSLPTDCLYLYRVTTEDSVSGKKLTGTVSGDFTLGETITGGTSLATGILSYGPSGGTYILVREIDGTFVVGETATGTTSGKTCSAITVVEDETVGDGTFPIENIVDPRDYTILKVYPPKIKFDENHYSIVADLRIKLEYQGGQGSISADTDIIFLPPHDLVEVATTFLPFSKVESNNLTAVFNKCLQTRTRIEARPPIAPYANAKRIIE
jgi:hypothetical protein